MSIQADYIRKIQALLATAESFAEQGNEEAAGAYVAKAHALQQKYSIDQATLEGGEKPHAIIDRTWAMPGTYGRRKVNLANVVARNTGCAGYFSRDAAGSYHYAVFGFAADVEWAETLFFSLCHQTEAALRFAVKHSYEHGRSFTTAFLDGFTTEVGRRLRAAAREAQAEAGRERAGHNGRAGHSVALVLAGKAKRVEAEMHAKVGRLSTSRLYARQSFSGYEQGRAAGREARLARGSVGGRIPQSLDR